MAYMAAGDRDSQHALNIVGIQENAARPDRSTISMINPWGRIETVKLNLFLEKAGYLIAPQAQ